MEANQYNILDLNDYCLGRILKYLEIKDHVNFGQVCTRFREVLKDWSIVLYPEFEIERSNDTDSDSLKWQLKLFCIISDVIKRLFLDIRQVDEQTPLHESFSVDNLCSRIETMESLEYFAIQEGSMFGRLIIKANPVRHQFIEKSLGALAALPQIKSVSISCKTDRYEAGSLLRLTCLQEVSMDNKIDSEDLVKICISNKNLRVLWLREVVGDLNDIVPHAENLEEIAFPMFGTHKSYAGLAELPNLKKVIIKGTTSTSPCANTIALLNAFATNKDQTKLESLLLYSSLSYDETSELIKLNFLKELRCSFDDAKSIELLTDLTELEGLYIMLGRSGNGAKECLNVLRSCTKLQRLHINSHLSTDFVEKALEVLRRVRNPEKQKPLQLYLTGVIHLCNEEGEKLVDNTYCTLVNNSSYLRALPWRFSN